MKRIILIGLALLGLIATGGMAWLLTRPGSPPAPEPYQVTQARTAVQVAELERSARSAEFWATFFPAATLTLFGLLVLALAAGIFLWVSGAAHQRRLAEARLLEEATRLNPDQAGNYPRKLTPYGLIE